MNRPLNPAERCYRVGETDTVFVKTEEGEVFSHAEVIGLEPHGDHMAPVFRATDGPMVGRELHWWHISFT